MSSVNGAPVPLEALQALALSNYGHFTTMRVEDGAVRGLSLHLERLVRDCHAVFGTELDPERVLSCVRREVGSRAGAVTVRVTVFDPALDMAHPGAGADPAILVTARAAVLTPPPPLTAKRFTFSRDAATVKHTGLFSQLRLRSAAQAAGFDDALFAEPDGRISEGCTWNVGFVDGSGAVVWPQAEVLSGITMRLLQAAHERTVTAPVLTEDLSSMRAAFATNTSIGVRRVSAIDEVTFPDGDQALKELREVYAGIPFERL